MLRTASWRLRTSSPSSALGAWRRVLWSLLWHGSAVLAAARLPRQLSANCSSLVHSAHGVSRSWNCQKPKCRCSEILVGKGGLFQATCGLKKDFLLLNNVLLHGVSNCKINQESWTSLGIVDKVEHDCKVCSRELDGPGCPRRAGVAFLSQCRVVVFSRSFPTADHNHELSIILWSLSLRG